MANNYTQFSEVIPNLTDKEIDWLNYQMEFVYVFDDTEYSAETLPDGVDLDKADWHGCRVLVDIIEREIFDDDFAGFEWELHDEEDGCWGRHFSIYADECGWVEPAAHLVQKFLKACRPSECWGLTFADYCSQLRVGEFGGGAVFVTADEVKWHDSYSFIEGEKQQFEKERSVANAS